MALKNIGVLWKKDKNGKKFLSGTLDNGIHGDIRIMIFPNEKGKSEKSPDYRIVMATDDAEETRQTSKDDFLADDTQEITDDTPTVEADEIPFA
jgi:uncharacterized protein (DUF736 family)